MKRTGLLLSKGLVNKILSRSEKLARDVTTYKLSSVPSGQYTYRG